jgi:hypothetical protein
MNRALDALRVVFGAALAVSALHYFLPSLMAFVPGYTWHEPMSVRLMTQFGMSGLLAVAMFIHLVGGALLVLNRGVPFALAAMVPVNLNGTYIALFVERDPAIGALAIVTMAINALLMFAYLPWYRGVLSPGQLADGEGSEPGQNYVSLFSNPLRNAPASAYPAAALVLAAAIAFYWFVVPGLNSTTGLGVLAIPTVLLAIGWARALTAKKA